MNVEILIMPRQAQNKLSEYMLKKVEIERMLFFVLFLQIVVVVVVWSCSKL